MLFVYEFYAHTHTHREVSSSDDGPSATPLISAQRPADASHGTMPNPIDTNTDVPLDAMHHDKQMYVLVFVKLVGCRAHI
jgi:hypothetical protein